jgi:hypothetical protein
MTNKKTQIVLDAASITIFEGARRRAHKAAAQLKERLAMPINQSGLTQNAPSIVEIG